MFNFNVFEAVGVVTVVLITVVLILCQRDDTGCSFSINEEEK